jgi:hypothetical protein
MGFSFLDIKKKKLVISFISGSTVITSDYNVWFHDSRSTGRTCYEKGYLSDFNNSDLLTCDGNKAVLVIYTQKLLEHHTTA